MAANIWALSPDFKTIVTVSEKKHTQQNLPVVCRDQRCEWRTVDMPSASELCPHRQVGYDPLVALVPAALHLVPRTSQLYTHIIIIIIISICYIHAQYGTTPLLA